MNEISPTQAVSATTDGLGETASVEDNLPSLGSSTGAELKKIELEGLKEQKAEALERKRFLMKNLPHRYGFKKYKWQREFIECYDKDAFLTAANQIGKSTIAVATAIEWITNTNLWNRLFKRRTPRVFWYLYPSLDLATAEFETKWVPDLLPKDGLRNDPVYGWKAVYNGKYIQMIKFNTGVTIFFKAYTQDVMNLQATTVDAIFTDEELPEEYWDELNFRRIATDGYFRMVFTATIGQKIWYDTMERQGTPEEKFPQAKKWQIGLYDCKFYEDGSESHITDAYIQRAILLCKSKAEEMKRVWGRFASDSGLKYPTFDRALNTCTARTIPRNWHIYIGVDIGSGGGEGHPSSIVFCGVSPEYTQAEVFDGWLGTENTTTDLDVYHRLMEMIAENNAEDRVTSILYDYHAKDFGTICQRNGLSVEKAEKSHDIGEAVLGVLFKTLNLKIQSRPVLDTLVFQLSNLKRDTLKRHAVDDYADGLRYALTRVPFDWEKIGVKMTIPTKAVPRVSEEDEVLKKRRDQYMKANHDTGHNEVIDVSAEMAAWGELYDI